jgi:MoxR-like ATPase
VTVTAIKRKVDVDQVAADLRAAVEEIGDEFLERREDAEGLVIAALAKGNAYLLGERGIAKSALCRRVREIFPEAKFFEKLMNRQLPDTALFGAPDIPRMKATGEWARNSRGKMQEAHFVFLDEAGKCGPTVLNPVLTIAVDHLFDDDIIGEMVPTPTITIVGASNEVLEPELSAMWDRFDFRKMMKPIQRPANRRALMESAFKPRAAAQQTTVALGDFQYVIDEVVPLIPVPDRILDALLGMYSKLAGDGIVPTDRRQKRAIRLMQASAFLNGRSTVDDDDVSVLQYVLWEREEEIDKVTSAVLALVSEAAKEAMNILSWVDQTNAEIDARKGQANRELAKFAVDVKHEIGKQRKALTKMLADAEGEGRSTAKLKTAEDAIQVLRLKVLTDLLKTEPERAAKILAAEDD